MMVTVPMEERSSTCEKHGTYTSKRVGTFGGWTQCSVCDKAIRMEQEQAKEKAAAVKKVSDWISSCNYAGIPPRYEGVSLDSYVAESEEQKKALAWARDYALNMTTYMSSGRSALLVGRPGTGKTHLAMSLALHALKIGKHSRVETTQRMIRRVKATWDKPQLETETQAVWFYTSADLLILDEVGIQFGSQYESNLMIDIINERHEHFRPTIFISNLGKQEAVTFLGDRLVDRLREDGGEVISFNWESHRSQ